MTTKMMPGRSTSSHSVQTAPGATSPDETKGNGDIADATITTIPDAEKLLIGSLLDAGPDTVAKVVAMVHDDDLADPHHRSILAAIRAAAGEGEAGVPAVSSRLLQSGVYGGPQGRLVQRRLLDAATAGAVGLAARSLAADVLECAQLRQLAGLCQVADAATTLPTAQRVQYVIGYVRGIIATTTRLTGLRQRTGVTE